MFNKKARIKPKFSLEQLVLFANNRASGQGALEVCGINLYKTDKKDFYSYDLKYIDDSVIQFYDCKEELLFKHNDLKGIIKYVEESTFRNKENMVRKFKEQMEKGVIIARKKKSNV